MIQHHVSVTASSNHYHSEHSQVLTTPGLIKLIKPAAAQSCYQQLIAIMKYRERQLSPTPNINSANKQLESLMAKYG